MGDGELIDIARKKSKASFDFGIIAVLLSGLFWAFSRAHQDAYGVCDGTYWLLIHLEWLYFLGLIISFRAVHLGVSRIRTQGGKARHFYNLLALAGIFLGCAVLLAPVGSMVQKNLHDMQGFYQIVLDFLRSSIVLWVLPLMVYVGVLGAVKNARALKTGGSDKNLILLVMFVVMALAGLKIAHFLWTAAHGFDCWHAGW